MALVRSRAALIALRWPSDLAEMVCREMWDAPTERFQSRLRSVDPRPLARIVSQDWHSSRELSEWRWLLDSLWRGTIGYKWLAAVDRCDTPFCRAIGNLATATPLLQTPEVTDYVALRLI
jgi:hypothetical protein